MKHVFKNILIIIILFAFFGCADSNGGNEGNGNGNGNNNTITPTPVPKFLWKDTFGKVMPADFPVLLEVLNSYNQSPQSKVTIYSGAAINISESEYNNIKNKLKIYYSSLLKEECKEVTSETGTICYLSAKEEKNGITYDFLFTHHKLNGTVALTYTIIDIH